MASAAIRRPKKNEAPTLDPDDEERLCPQPEPLSELRVMNRRKVEDTGVTCLNYSNGDVYKGMVRDGKKHGKGLYDFSSGTIYQGEWKNNKMSGLGAMYYENGATYEGEWDNGMREGLGRFVFANGTLYTGSFHRNNFHGWGVYLRKTGYLCQGEWKMNEFFGKGYRYTPSSSKPDTGAAKNGKSEQGVFKRGKLIVDLDEFDTSEVDALVAKAEGVAERAADLSYRVELSYAERDFDFDTQ
mmetsp:Transcript_42238/g.108766  ORF Transcript_42238/g.108766 Transcript_42238/m.108766 type:complete len:242 (-) Transcript_42238:35-760(-)